MRPANTGFEHASAPNRNLLRLAQVMDTPRRGVSSYAPELDIDNPAGTQFDGRARMLLGVDTFIEADRRVELALQLRVTIQVVPTQRLFNHHEVVCVEPLQVGPIFKSICRICIHHQTYPREPLAQPLNRLNVLP